MKGSGSPGSGSTGHGFSQDRGNVTQLGTQTARRRCAVQDCGSFLGGGSTGGNFTEVPAVVSVVVLCCCHGLGAVARMQL